jgi:hypothetical protein
MNLLEFVPLNIKNLLMRLEKNKNYNNNELILSRFYSLNSDDQIINKIFENLKYDKILNKFKEPINIQKVKSLFLKEYCPEFFYKEENKINPSQSSIIFSQKNTDVNFNIIQNYIQTIKTPDLIKNDNFSQLLSNSLKNDNNNFIYVNNSNNTFHDKINDNNEINTDKKQFKSKNFFLQKKRKPLVKFKKILKEKQIKKNKINYGLKEISKMVINIIKRQKQTSYKEISDEIVNIINKIGIKEQKNIRRRIYDSLNVMKSMNLFSKEKKTKKIFWNEKKEIQNEINDIYNINKEIETFSDIINLKKEKINNLLEQYKSLNYIIERNKIINHRIDENKKIYCPFIFFGIPNVEKENPKKEIRVLMNENKNKIHIAFNSKLQLHGDLDAIKKIKNNFKFK